MNKIYLIGIGYKPLDLRAKTVLDCSEVILASTRLFEVFKGYPEFESVKDRIKVINNVNETLDYMKGLLTQPQISGHIDKHIDAKDMERNNNLHVVLASEAQKNKLPCDRVITLLASGDPMFFGIGRRAVQEFGKETVEIIPDLSSVQTAFSRIQEPWDDAMLMSLHGGHDARGRLFGYKLEDVPVLLMKHKKLAILTDKVNNPAEIARKILDSPEMTRQSGLKIYVCEKLGYGDEKIIEGSPEKMAKLEFADPNVVIICGSGSNISELPATDIMFGLREEEISHSRGLITKDEIRAVTLHKLRLPSKGIFWDVGAGSGSVSLEAARLSSGLQVLAIEKDKEQLKNLRSNKPKFSLSNLEIIEGEAPECLPRLPVPSRLFIGGNSGKLAGILNHLESRQFSGIVVINATTIETLNEAVQLLENCGYSVEISQVSIARTKVIARKKHLSALNPVFVIAGEKGRR